MIGGQGRRRGAFDGSGIPLAALGLIGALFLAAPLVGLLLNVSGTDLAGTYGDPRTRGAVLTSLGTATVSTALVAVVGVPLAYLLARFRFPGRAVVSALVSLPLVLPPVSAGILLLLLYGPYGTIGGLLSPHGIALTDTAAGIVLAQMFVSAPFIVVAARSAFQSLDLDYEEAAASMGASLWATFRHVALPMARGGIVAGLVLGWMRALGEFGATVILAYHPYSLPVLNYVDLTSSGLQTALPLALLAVLLAGAVLVALVFLERVTPAVRWSRP